MPSSGPTSATTRRWWLAPVVLLATGLVMTVTLYEVQNHTSALRHADLVEQIWSELNVTVILGAIVAATFERSSRRDLEDFVHRLTAEQNAIARRILETTSVRALLAEKMTPAVFSAVQRQILDIAELIRDYRLAIRIHHRSDDEEYVDIEIHERYRFCNGSPETRALTISITADLQYEDLFPNSSYVSEVSIIGRRSDNDQPDDSARQVLLLDKDKLDSIADRLGGTLAYDIQTRLVPPGDEVVVSIRRTKVQRSTDVNFWRAVHPTESVELEIQHDTDITVEAFSIEPWNRSAVRTHVSPRLSVWALTQAVLPHQGYDISWQSTRQRSGSKL